MGKGNNSDCAAAMPSAMMLTGQDSSLADSRLRWRPVLRDQLRQLIEQASLSNASLTDAAFDKIMKRFTRRHAPHWHISDFRRLMRLELIKLMIKDDAVPGAITMAFSTDLSTDDQQEMIKQITEAAIWPQDISRCRHAQAALDYRTGNLEGARAKLQEDQADKRVHHRRRSFAETKLQALEGLEAPHSWEESMIPDDMRDAEPEAWQALHEMHKGQSESRAAGSKLSHLLAASGRAEEALKLCDRMLEQQWNDSKVEWVHLTRAVILNSLGRQDEMTQSAEAPNHIKEKALDKLADQLMAAGDKAESYSMRIMANQAARARMEKSSQALFTSAKRHYLERLIQYNYFDEAWQAANQEDANDNLLVIERQLLVLVSACRYSPPRWLPELRRLSQDSKFKAMVDPSPPNDLKQQALALL